MQRKEGGKDAVALVSWYSGGRKQEVLCVERDARPCDAASRLSVGELVWLEEVGRISDSIHNFYRQYKGNTQLARSLYIGIHCYTKFVLL